MSTELPKLVVLNLYRESLAALEKISRAKADKKVHAWAVKAKKEVGDIMMQVAQDEMYGEEVESEEEKRIKAEEEFNG